MHPGSKKPVRDYGSAHYVSLSTIVSTTYPSTIKEISCAICQSNIDISKRGKKNVVLCSQCHEATPVGPAPKGKKYARCQCKCLLVCCETALKIACPRTNCKRVTHLISSSSHKTMPMPSVLFTCAYCCNPFRSEPPTDPAGCFVQCPHFQCKNMTMIGGSRLATKWAIFYTFLSVIFIALAIGVMWSAYYVDQSSRGGLYAGYIGLFLVAMIFLVRSIFYWTIQVSERQGSA